MSPSEYSELAEIKKTFEMCNQDDMGKFTGAWFNKGMNKLTKLFGQAEQDMMDALGIDKVDLDD